MGISASGNLGDIVSPLRRGGYVDLATGLHHSLAEIDAAAGRFATGVKADGYNRGDRIAIIASNGADFVVTYLGLMRAGIVPVPINTRLPAEAIAYILADCDARATYTHERWEGVLPSQVRRLDRTAHDRFMKLQPAEPVQPAPGEIAEILYTSGSTGRPKGVPLTHEGQLWALELFAKVSSNECERTVVAAPCYHMNGLFFTMVGLQLGYLTVSLPSFDARTYLDAVSRYRATVLSGIPTMFALMAREQSKGGDYDLSSVRDVIIGSAPLTEALVDQVRAMFPNASVRNSYGTTETGPAMFGPHPDGVARPALAMGYPYPGVEWRLEGSNAPNQGELIAKTPATLNSYLNLPEVTDERLSAGWYRTGDIVRRDEDGFFYFVGRVDDMFVCGGENVYPGEIEKLIERHPSVSQAAVVAVEDAIKGMIPIAFVVPRDPGDIDLVDIKNFTLRHGPAFAHPRAIAAIDTLPTGGTHKIDRAKLSRMAIEIGQGLER